MNIFFNQFDAYHHLNFFSLICFLYLGSKIMIQSLIQTSKENEDALDNTTLIHFELFISYPTLILLISAISNTVQLLIAMLLHQLSDFSLLICFVSSSIFNGIVIWWALVKLRRTSYRKSKFLWIISSNILLTTLNSFGEVSITTIFNYFVSLFFQCLGTFLGMAIGSLNIQDAYGEFKQQFLDNIQTTSLRQKVRFHIIYGFLPFLSLIRITNQIVLEDKFFNTIDLIYFALIQVFQAKIMTYTDDANLKSNWGQKSMKLAKSPMYYVIAYQCLISVNSSKTFSLGDVKDIGLCDFMIFVISNGAAGLSSILTQKQIQEQKK